jgi:hypothetical protein
MRDTFALSNSVSAHTFIRPLRPSVRNGTPCVAGRHRYFPNATNATISQENRYSQNSTFELHSLLPRAFAKRSKTPENRLGLGPETFGGTFDMQPYHCYLGFGARTARGISSMLIETRAVGAKRDRGERGMTSERRAQSGNCMCMRV